MDLNGTITAVDYRGRIIGSADVSWTLDLWGAIIPVGKPQVVVQRKGQIYEVVCLIGSSKKIIPWRPALYVNKHDVLQPTISIRPQYDA